MQSSFMWIPEKRRIFPYIPAGGREGLGPGRFQGLSSGVTRSPGGTGGAAIPSWAP